MTSRPQTAKMLTELALSPGNADDLGCKLKRFLEGEKIRDLTPAWRTYERISGHRSITLDRLIYVVVQITVPALTRRARSTAGLPRFVRYIRAYCRMHDKRWLTSEEEERLGHIIKELRTLFPTEGKPPPVTLDAATLTRLGDYATLRGSPNDRQLFAMILVGARLAFRPNEIVSGGLRCCDVELIKPKSHTETAAVRITKYFSKTNKWTTSGEDITMPDDGSKYPLSKVLKRYAREQGLILGADVECLLFPFSSDDVEPPHEPRPWKQGTFVSRMRRLITKAGCSIDPIKVGGHTLRRTALTHWKRHFDAVRKLGEPERRLGWKDPIVARRYDKRSQRERAAAIATTMAIMNRERNNDAE